MEADSFRIAKVFSNGGDTHFRLPYFQREYAWEPANWQTLLDDILDIYGVYNDKNPPEHFMGSLVVVSEGTQHGIVPVFKLVDGQQRLTTITLILCALAETVKTSQPEKYNKIRKYITNPDETGELRYKLLPTAKHGDRSTYLSILDGKEIPDGLNGSKILPAYKFYLEKLGEPLQKGELDAERLFLVIINCLQVVFINLNNQEKPYQIFESLNAKGKPLTQADLVRNYIAMKLPEVRQVEVFENHWSKIDDMLREDDKVGRSRLGKLTAFLRHYLAFRNGVLANEEHVYARFRDRIEAEFKTPELFEEEVVTLKRFAVYYDRFMNPEKEKDRETREALKRLNDLEISTGYPLLLAMFDALEGKKIDRSQLLEGLRILENYMVRRYLTGEPTNYLNKTFPTLWKDIDTAGFIPSLKKALLDKNYPADYAIREKAKTRRLYDNSQSTRAKTALLLETVNRHLYQKAGMGGYAVLEGAATIEHILPQTPGEPWKNDLGENFNQIYDQYLHTLGNLTLVNADWNSELSNLPFAVKRAKLAEHALLLNSGYFNTEIPCWNDEAIQARAGKLVESILEIWPAIGNQPAPNFGSGTIPVSFTFQGKVHPVVSWRDLAQQTTEAVIQAVDHFADVAATVPGYLSRSPFQGTHRKLSNGWFLYVNLSGNAIKRYCRDLVARAGFAAADWQVEEKPYG